jgi:hypothetical protein
MAYLFTIALVGRYAHDYYGDSVAMSLAAFRQSRSTVMNNVIRMG